MKDFEWAQPASVAEAVTMLARPGATAYAGGVDLLDRMKEGLDAPTRLVSLRKLPGNNMIAEEGGVLRVGAGVTLARLDSDPVVRQRYVALADSAGHAATPQVRAMATVGGNIAQRPRCWYFRSELFACKKKGGSTCFAHDGDNQHHAIFENATCAIVHPSSVATALVAYGARAVIVGPDGKTTKTREVELAQLFMTPERDVTREIDLAPGEVITELRVPAPSASARAAYTKQGAKRSFDWPIAEVAVVLELAGSKCTKASVVLGAAAPAPWRARAAETALVGNSIDAKTAGLAARAALEGARPLTDNGHKLDVFRAVVARTIIAAARGNGGSP